MHVADYLDSTYLKTTAQTNITSLEMDVIIENLVKEAIGYQFKMVMVRPNYVSFCKKILQEAKSSVLLGTVIGFPEGNYAISEKLDEAQQAILDGVDDLDFVVNYQAFKNDQINLVKSEVFQCTKLGLENGKTVKWIIEIAALNNKEIALITSLIRDVVELKLSTYSSEHVFVKSSTGFYKTDGDKPTGATLEGLRIISENVGSLSIKASGGIRNIEDVKKYMEIGVSRFGTSSAKTIFEGNDASASY